MSGSVVIIKASELHWRFLAVNSFEPAIIAHRLVVSVVFTRYSFAATFALDRPHLQANTIVLPKGLFRKRN